MCSLIYRQNCIKCSTADLLCCFRGQTPTESEENFLKIVAKLDTYGVDPHCVKVTVLILLLLLTVVVVYLLLNWCAVVQAFDSCWCPLLVTHSPESCAQILYKLIATKKMHLCKFF